MQIAAEVSDAYWALWLVLHARELEQVRVQLLKATSEFVRIRVETSAADISDLTQINLRVTKAEDVLAGLDQRERAASARLVRVVGAPDGTPTPVNMTPPQVGLPGEDEASLRQAAAAHPRVQALALKSASSEQRVRQARSDRAPSVGLGVDWIVTGPAIDPATPDSGKDAVVGMAALKIPLSAGAYRAGEQEARARGRMYRARELAVRNRAVEEFERSMAALRDSARRVSLYETTMIPLAESSYEAVRASYQSGRASVAEILMAERELIDQRHMALHARVDAAGAWATLERVVGRPIQAPTEAR